MPRIVIDNTPAVADFNDGDPLTNGAANLARSLIEAPQHAAAIRRQEQNDQIAQVWKQKEFDRQGQNDEMQRLWHDQAQGLAQRQLDSLDADRKANESRHTMESAGRGALNLARLVGNFFGMGQRTKPPITQAQAWQHALDIAKSELPRDPLTGQPAVAVHPQRVQELYEGVLAGKIPVPDEAPPVIEQPAPPAAAPPASDGWWNHIFGTSPDPQVPEGGQLTGNDFEPPGDQGAPAPAPAATGGKTLRTSRISALVKSGQYPDLKTAIAHAQSLGYSVVDDGG